MAGILGLCDVFHARDNVYSWRDPNTNTKVFSNLPGVYNFLRSDVMNQELNKLAFYRVNNTLCVELAYPIESNSLLQIDYTTLLILHELPFTFEFVKANETSILLKIVRKNYSGVFARIEDFYIRCATELEIMKEKQNNE